MTRIDPRAYAIAMLRRDLYREPTEHEVRIWVDWFSVSGAFAPVRDSRPESGATDDGEDLSADCAVGSEPSITRREEDLNG